MANARIRDRFLAGTEKDRLSQLAIAVVLTVILGYPMSAQAIAREGAERSAKTEPVWAEVTRAKGHLAEFRLNVRHGLWTGDQVTVYRRDERGAYAPADTLQVVMADLDQAVGKGDVFFPKPGDRVLFRKPVPSEDASSPFNRMIGSFGTISPRDHQKVIPPLHVRILKVELASSDDIKSVTVGRKGSKNPLTYYVRDIRMLRVGDEIYVPDPGGSTLASLAVVTERERQRLAVREAERRERERIRQEAEKRLRAEAEARAREEAARIAAWRAREQERQRQYVGSRSSSAFPATSYSFLDSGQASVDRRREQAFMKIMGALLAHGVSQVESTSFGDDLVIAFAGMARDGLVDSALRDLDPQMPGPVVRAIRRALCLAAEGKLTKGRYTLETGKDEMLEILKNESPDYVVPAHAIDFGARVLESLHNRTSQ